MKELMLVLSFVIGYPLFMAFTYLLIKIIFPSTDKVMAEQQREREMLLIKAQRIKKYESTNSTMILTQ
ncbi:MAG TPA: hypothetical protein VD884_07915 [Ohtaekwangia sp.]|nr:hypothetical protein [Ohtaekwangia sp.]